MEEENHAERAALLEGPDNEAYRGPGADPYHLARANRSMKPVAKSATAHPSPYGSRRNPAASAARPPPCLHRIVALSSWRSRAASVASSHRGIPECDDYPQDCPGPRSRLHGRRKNIPTHPPIRRRRWACLPIRREFRPAWSILLPARRRKSATKSWPIRRCARSRFPDPSLSAHS